MVRVQRAILGEWYLVPEPLIHHHIGRLQGQQYSDRNHRRYIVGRPIGGGRTILFPRTTRPRKSGQSRQGIIEHQPHEHIAQYPNCSVDEIGRILDVQMVTNDAELVNIGLGCKEPNSTSVKARVSEWMDYKRDKRRRN